MRRPYHFLPPATVDLTGLFERKESQSGAVALTAQVYQVREER